MTVSVNGADTEAIFGGKKPRWELTFNTPTGRVEYWYFNDPTTLLGGPRIVILNQWGRTKAERVMEFEFTRGPGYPGPYTSQYSKSLSGTVEEEGSPVARTVRVYERSTGALVAETVSDPVTGAYSFPQLTDVSQYYVVFLDADAAPDFNAIIYDKLTAG